MSTAGTDSRCQHINGRGHRCRQPSADAHLHLCGDHLLARQRRLRAEPALLSRDLLSDISNLHSAAAVNQLIHNLVVLLADDRIPARKAAVMAYLSQLALQTLQERRREQADYLASHPPEIVYTFDRFGTSQQTTSSTESTLDSHAPSAHESR